MITPPSQRSRAYASSTALVVALVVLARPVAAAEEGPPPAAGEEGAPAASAPPSEETVDPVPDAPGSGSASESVREGGDPDGAADPADEAPTPRQPRRSSADVTLLGVNGREATLAGVLDASRQGLRAAVKPGGDIIRIPWKRLDLLNLELEHPGLWTAYQEATRTGRRVDLRLGTFAGLRTYDETVTDLAAALDQPLDVPVPGFDEFWSGAGNVRTLLESFTDRSAGKKRDKAHEDYRRFLDEFFPGRDLKINFLGVPEVKSVEMSSRDVLAYLADPKKKSDREATVYFKNHPGVTSGATAALALVQSQFPNPLFDTRDRSHVALPRIVKSAASGVGQLGKGGGKLPDSAARSVADLLEALPPPAAASTRDDADAAAVVR